MKKRATIKTYHELMLLPSFEERFEYLKLGGQVGRDNDAVTRYLLQQFYHSSNEWKRVRSEVIIRDSCGSDVVGDLADIFRPIYGPVTIHHINPITTEDLEEHSDFLLDPDNLICVSHETHNAIHYGSINSIRYLETERKPNDTIPWR